MLLRNNILSRRIDEVMQDIDQTKEDLTLFKST